MFAVRSVPDSSVQRHDQTPGQYRCGHCVLVFSHGQFPDDSLQALRARTADACYKRHSKRKLRLCNSVRMSYQGSAGAAHRELSKFIDCEAIRGSC
jgi:hypothetical protein